MEKKNEDGGRREEGERREQLTLQQNKHHPQRPLSSCIGIDYQINRRKIPNNGNDHHYPPIILPSEHLSLQMKSSTLPQYTSNPSLVVKNKKPQQIYDEEATTSTYSFRHRTSQLQHAKSHGELYQPTNSLSLSPLKPSNHEENKSKQQEKYPSINTSLRVRPTATADAAPSLTQTSPTNKIPLWKRFKKLIIPSKRSKDRANISSKIPTLLLNDSSENESIPDSSTKNLLHNPIKLTDLKTWISSKTFPEEQIRAEYQKLPSESLHPKTVALQSENRTKNRFNLIEPYDHSRVILKTLPNDPTSDYINASYIDGLPTKKMYIAAQAPTEGTLHDFIRMIWQLRIQSIIMLTRLFEDGKHKCLQYWPDEGEKQINQFKIRIDLEEKYAFYTIRRFTLFNQLEPADVLIVKQFHFLSWPDHDCVSLPTPLLDFRQRFRTDFKSLNPILVHCSAGVGRSGTFIALDALLETIQTEDIIDVLQFTHRMRENRVYMIQTVDQYVFLYRALIEGILTMKTSVPLQEFMITRKVYLDIKDQYKLLEQLQSTIEYSYRGALDPSNANKNRVESILAADNSRPYLMTQVEKGTDYINAVFVNSYRQTSNYIVTQYPLPNTLIDFCRLIYDHNIAIIMLVESIPRDPKNPPYWPFNVSQTVSFGPFEILLTSQKEDDSLIERVLELKFINKNAFTNERPKLIRQFQVKDSTRLLSVVKRFLKEMRTRSDQNVLLQCLNGTTWSGYFVSLCNAIDQMQTEQIIDPFKTVRLLRANREQFINQNQYENLFVSMIDYTQQYLSHLLAMDRAVENSVYMNTSGGSNSISTKKL